MSDRGICLLSFAKTDIVKYLFSHRIMPQFLDKLSNKSFLGVELFSSFEDVNPNETIESIVPFLEDSLIAYSHFFFLEKQSENQAAKSKRIPFGLILVVNKSEQMKLYRYIPNIVIAVKEVIELLTKRFEKKPQIENLLTRRITKEIVKIVNFEDLGFAFDRTKTTKLLRKRIRSSEFKEKISTEKSRSLTSQGNFDLLIKRIPEGLHKAIYSLLMNKRVLVVGKPEEISASIATLRDFIPHKKLYNDLLTVPLMDAQALFSRTANSVTMHILGIDEECFSNFFPKLCDLTSEEEKNDSQRKNDSEIQNEINDRLIIDFRKGKVFGGKSCTFCQEVLDKVSKVPYEKGLQLIERTVNQLLEKSNQLISLSFVSSIKPDELDRFISKLAADELEIILTLIQETNPILYSRIKMILEEKLHISL